MKPVEVTITSPFLFSTHTSDTLISEKFSTYSWARAEKVSAEEPIYELK